MGASLGQRLCEPASTFESVLGPGHAAHLVPPSPPGPGPSGPSCPFWSLCGPDFGLAQPACATCARKQYLLKEGRYRLKGAASVRERTYVYRTIRTLLEAILNYICDNVCNKPMRTIDDSTTTIQRQPKSSILSLPKKGTELRTRISLWVNEFYLIKDTD